MKRENPPESRHGGLTGYLWTYMAGLIQKGLGSRGGTQPSLPPGVTKKKKHPM
jgi:hypothetical protein